MSQSSLAFVSPEPVEPPVLIVARSLAQQLRAGEPITRTALNARLAAQFGGSDAHGCWSVRESHAALELAQVLFLAGEPGLTLRMQREQADATFSRLEALTPSQTSRSDDQIEWQQFATPPRLAWIAAQAACIRPSDRVLEPSAGTGMLAVWAAKAGATLALNEISLSRRDSLAAIFRSARVSGYDAELIDERLDPAVRPSVVLMNPPFSRGVERGHDGRTGARHLRSAWNRMAPGGRLVAIMPQWFDVSRFRSKRQGRTRCGSTSPSTGGS